MEYSLPISETKARDVRAFLNNKREFAIFKVLGMDEDCVFFFVHGTPTGKISVKGADVALEVLARSIVHKIKAQDNAVTTVYTISCYGGMQEACVVEGVSFKSMHDSKDEISARLFEGIDGGYALDLFI